MEQAIVDYIKQSQAQGLSRAQITAELKKQGWQDRQIEDVFKRIHFRKSRGEKDVSIRNILKFLIIFTTIYLALYAIAIPQIVLTSLDKREQEKERIYTEVFTEEVAKEFIQGITPETIELARPAPIRGEVFYDEYIFTLSESKEGGRVWITPNGLRFLMHFDWNLASDGRIAMVLNANSFEEIFVFLEKNPQLKGFYIPALKNPPWSSACSIYNGIYCSISEQEESSEFGQLPFNLQQAIRAIPDDAWPDPLGSSSNFVTRAVVSLQLFGWGLGGLIFSAIFLSTFFIILNNLIRLRNQISLSNLKNFVVGLIFSLVSSGLILLLVLTAMDFFGLWYPAFFLLYPTILVSLAIAAIFESLFIQSFYRNGGSLRFTRISLGAWILVLLSPLVSALVTVALSGVGILGPLS